MISIGLLLTLALGASGEPRRPRSVVVTEDGDAAATPLADTLRQRLRETFGVDAASIEGPRTSTAGRSGDFGVRLTSTASSAIAIEVTEDGAVIARRAVPRTPDVELDVWLILRAALTRALLDAPPTVEGSAPPTVEGSAPPTVEGSASPTVDALEAHAEAPVSRARPDDEGESGPITRGALRVSGRFEVATVGVGGAGALGVETTWALGEVDALLGLEVGFARAVRDGRISVDRVPATVLAGLWVSEAIPVAVGLVGSVDWERASTARATQNHVRARFGAFGRGRLDLSQAFAVLIEGRIEAPTRRLRYVLENGASLTELPISLSIGTGLEWRWR